MATGTLPDAGQILNSLINSILLVDDELAVHYANPAAQAMCRSHPLWSEDEQRLEDLLPTHALPQARDQAQWSDFVPFGEGRMLSARLLLLEEQPGHTLQQAHQETAVDMEKADQQGGQDHKQAHGQRCRQDHRHGQGHVGSGLAQLFGKPEFKLRGLLVHRAEHPAAFFQRLHALAQHGDKAHRSADEGLAHPRVLFGQGLAGFAGNHDVPVGAADGDGDRLRPLHHHALQDGLAADVHGPLIGAVLFVLYTHTGLRSGTGPLLSSFQACHKAAFMQP